MLKAKGKNLFSLQSSVLNLYNLLASHQPGELIKKILGILGAWRCFRVILNGKSRQGSVPESFQGLIVEVDMGYFDII